MWSVVLYGWPVRMAVEHRGPPFPSAEGCALDKETVPDPSSIQTPAEFLSALRRLRLWSGLSYRQLSKRAAGEQVRQIHPTCRSTPWYRWERPTYGSATTTGHVPAACEGSPWRQDRTWTARCAPRA